MIYIEWGVWILAALLTLFMFVTWLAKSSEYVPGEFYNTDEVVTLKALPRIAITEALVLLGFLLVDVSKFHIIWIYPIIYFFIMSRIAKRFVDRDR